MKTIVLLCGLFGYLATARGATYFVDFEGGSDSNAGTSESLAWKRCPGDPKATDTPSRTQLIPGDTIRFKGGVVYVGQIKVGTSGATNNVITYDGNHPETWGTGRAVLDGNHAPKTIAMFDGQANVSHITIRGFEIRNVGGYSDDDPVLAKKCADFVNPKGGKGGLFAREGIGLWFERGGHTNLRFEHLYIHRCGQWRNTPPFANVTGFGIAVKNANGVVIQHCDISKTRNGISIKATDTIQNVEVADCVLHDFIVWCIDVAPQQVGATLRNITIRDSVFRDYHQHDWGNWQGCGETPHTDGIFLRTAGMASRWDNVKIFNCDFYADYTGNSKGGTASIYVSQGPSALIYNCTFRSDRHSRAIYVAYRNPAATPIQVVRIYNNSFLFSATPIFIASETNNNPREVYIQNNIMVRSGGRNLVMVARDSGPAPVTMDNNVYWDPQLSSGVRLVYHDKGFMTFKETQSRGLEAKGIFADPRFANAKTNRPSGRDLRLTAGSSAIQRGANLSAWFTEDKLGKPRPAAGPWTCGAFEYP